MDGELPWIGRWRSVARIRPVTHAPESTVRIAHVADPVDAAMSETVPVHDGDPRSIARHRCTHAGKVSELPPVNRHVITMYGVWPRQRGQPLLKTRLVNASAPLSVRELRRK